MAAPPLEDLASDPLLQGIPTRDGAPFLDPCRLLRQIGAGATGVVYQGVEERLQIEVAVKILHPALAQEDPRAVERFLREARLNARLNHPNLVRVYGVDSRHGRHYLWMEFVEGESLRERVWRHGFVAPAEATALLLGAARGLAVVHQAGIVHRDIKPENLLVTRDGHVKVADLGFAKSLSGDSLGLTKNLLGTPRYMAPEQWQDARHAGPPADVWAMGATLFYLLTAQEPIRGETLAEVCDQVRHAPFPDVQQVRGDVPASLVKILRRCTERDPAARYPTAIALVDALTAAAPAPTTAHAGPLARAATPQPATKVPAPAPAPARFLDPCVVLEEIGRTGFSTLHRGHIPRMAMYVMVEVLEANEYHDEFLQGAHLGMRLEHPNLVRVLGAHETAGTCYQWSQFPAGGTLAARIRAGGTPADALLKLAQDMANGLAKLHGLGVVHRNLHPGSLFLTRDQRAQIGVFTLARQPGTPQSREVRGTPGYMPPEQCQKGSVLTPATDIWALGATLFDLMVGCSPVLAAGSLARPPIELSGHLLPPRLRRILARCVHDDPAERYPHGSALLRDLS